MNTKACYKLKFSLFLAVLISCLATFISCRNLFDDIETPNSDAVTVTLNGTVRSVFSDTGAVPAEFTAQLMQSDETDSRAAIPTMPTGCTTTVSATANDGTTIPAQTLTENTFTLPLVSGKKWAVTVTMKNGSTVILSDSKEFDLTSVGAVSHEFILKPVSGGTGNVSLTLAIEATSIKNILIEISGQSTFNWKKNTSNNTWSIPGNQSQSNKTNPNITINGLNSGVYTATFRFFDTDSNGYSSALLFSMLQEINVLPTLTTNKWILDGTESNTLSITQDMVDTYGRTDFFVGDCGTETPDDTNGTGSPYKPVATITKALALIGTMPTNNSSNQPIEYTIHVKDRTTEDISSTITINKKIKIECWKDTVGDTRGTATLKWVSDTNTCMVSISSGGTLTIEGENTASETWSGLVLDGNKDAEKRAAGIKCIAGGTLNLNGGTITNCKGSINYATALMVSGTVVMKGGKISDNTLSTMGTIYIGDADSPSFTMKGGIICDNIYEGTAGYSPSVYIAKGSFTMEGGEITRNTTNQGCGGVSINNNENSIFTMTGGKIYGNTNIGVKVANNTKFNLGGSAYIAPDNVVSIAFVNSGSTKLNSPITIISELTPPAGSNVITATITPSNGYGSTNPVVVAADGVSDDVFTAACSKFAVTPNGSNKYYVNSQGIIVLKQSYTNASSAGTAISGLTTSSAISVSGTITDTEFSSLASAINGITTAGVTVSLDLSDSTGLTSISQNTFKNCTHISEIILPNTITELGASIFEGCTNLTRVVLPTSLTTYNNSIFYDCPNLTEIIIPTAPETIGSAVFWNCSNLISVTLPGGNYNLFVRNFTGCSKLKQIIYGGTKSEWRNKAVAETMGSGVDNVKIICSDGTMTYHATSSESDTGTLTDD